MSSVCGLGFSVHRWWDFRTVKKTRETVDKMADFISKAPHIILGLRCLEKELLKAKFTPLEACRVVLGVLNTMHINELDQSKMDRIQAERVSYLKKVQKIEQEPLVRPIRVELRSLVQQAGEIDPVAIAVLPSAEFMDSLDQFHPQHRVKLAGLIPFALEERFRAIHAAREDLAERCKGLGVNFLELVTEEVMTWCDAHPESRSVRFDLVGQQAFMFSRVAELVLHFPTADQDLLAIALTATLEGMDPPSAEKVAREMQKYESRLPQIKEELAKEGASLESVLAILKASS